MALIPTLLLLRAIELPERGLSVSPVVAWFFAIGGVIGGAVWLGVLSVLHRWADQVSMGAAVIFLAGVGQSYLLMPLAHHLTAGPPGFSYITNSANFFATNPWLQLLAFAVAAGLALAAVWFRRWLARRDIASLPEPVTTGGAE